MTLDQAKNLIKACAEQMHAQYQKTVFDEWAVVSLGENKGRILAYIGPRKDGFRENFATDISALRTALVSTNHHIGDFEFNRALARQGVKRLFLHARRIVFKHPVDGKRIALESPLHKDMLQFCVQNFQQLEL